MSHELHSALHSSGPWKAPGHDRVPLAMLRKCEDILTPYLLPLYSASLRLHHIPPTWKVANVIAVPKANGDLSSVTGYRPISLLCCVAKVLETIITARLTFHLESKGLLTSTQYGFRKRHNTEQALWQLISDASKNLQAGKRTVTLSLDIKSAYDRVWHPGLLRKLADFDIHPDLLGWIASFLENRVAHTLVGSVEVVRPLLMGVPQGSPLSPILFLIYIQDLLDRLTGVPGAKVQAFADDLIAWWTLNRGCFGTAIASDLRRILEDWETKWKMEFSPPKCKLLVIGRTHDPPPSFFLKGVALPRVMCLRYLGIWIDARLTWRTHIRLVTQKAMDRLRRIRRGIGMLWGFHPIIAKHMIDAVIIPTLFYATSVWSTAVCRANCMRLLDRVLRQCALSVFGLHRTVSLEASQAISGILPAEFQIWRHLVEFYLRQLVNHHDLLTLTSTIDSNTIVNNTAAPIDILKLELRHLERFSPGLPLALTRVETRRWWYADPTDPDWEPSPSILSRDSALSRIRVARLDSPAHDL